MLESSSGASSLYLVENRVGVSSDSVAVIFDYAFPALPSNRRARRDGFSNFFIVRLPGSAGESIAFRLGVTMPAILNFAVSSTFARDARRRSQRTIEDFL